MRKAPYFFNLKPKTSMPEVTVVRQKRKSNYSQPDSPELYYLRQEPGTAKIYNITGVAARIEALGALSAEDVEHTMKAFIRELRTILTEGHKVKVDGLGIFHTTIKSKGVDTEKECTVKNIERVNIRFKVDNTLRLVNNAIATTRNAPNNVEYVLKNVTVTSTGSGSGSSGTGEDDDEYIDPNA